MKHKIFAMTDIHGCYDEMMALYKQLPIDPEKDQLVVCGDFIDRGPASNKVVQQLMDWKKKYPHWQILYGNHEDLMIDALVREKKKIYNDFYLWWNQGGKETALSYVPEDRTEYEKAITQPEAEIPEEHLEFITTLPRWYESDDYIFVHAGLEPGKTPEETDPYEMIWIRDRFIDSTYDWGKKVIFGHTADYNGKYYNSKNEWGKRQMFRPIVKSNKIGLDTAVCPPSAVRLTAIELPSETFYFEEAHKRS